VAKSLSTKKISALHLEVIKEKMTKVLQSGQCPQVMLFSGPKGTGKTSTARLIGAILNTKENYETADQIFYKNEKGTKPFADPDLDDDLVSKIFSGNSFLVEEIDAASNRRIEDVRSLKDKIFVPPSLGKMKVYILDEVHMFTNEAFNALLKILEEPPKFVVFVLATTEIYKIPGTVLSRCTIFDFQKASEAEIILVLKNILEKEEISYQEEALKTIAFYADGSFRDAIKSCENIASLGEINIENTNKFLDIGIISLSKDLLTAVVDKKINIVLESIETLRNKNINEAFFLKLLANTLHESLVTSISGNSNKALFNQKISLYLLKILDGLKIESGIVPFLSLEIALVEIIFKANNKGGSSSKSSVEKKIVSSQIKVAKDNSKKIVSSQIKVAKDNSKKIEVQEDEDEEAVTENNDSQIDLKEVENIKETESDKSEVKVDLIKNFDSNEKIGDHWNDLMIEFDDNFSLRTLFKNAVLVEETDKKITLGFIFKLHKTKMESKKNIEAFYKCCEKLNLPTKRIETQLTKKSKEKKYNSEKTQDKIKKDDVSKYFL
jgi:DNA polymerase-3 subunit gamma/tau